MCILSEYGLFYTALLQKRPIILRSLLKSLLEFKLFTQVIQVIQHNQRQKKTKHINEVHLTYFALRSTHPLNIL